MMFISPTGYLNSTDCFSPLSLTVLYKGLQYCGSSDLDFYTCLLFTYYRFSKNIELHGVKVWEIFLCFQKMYSSILRNNGIWPFIMFIDDFGRFPNFFLNEFSRSHLHKGGIGAWRFVVIFLLCKLSPIVIFYDEGRRYGLRM
jgi:hypothetical protein